MSGLIPGVTLRKTLRIASSPKKTEELDCSPENSVDVASGSRSWPGTRWKFSAAVLLLGEAPQPGAHRHAVVQRVVGVHPAVLGVLPPADEGVVEPVLGLGVVDQRHLVELAVVRRRR